MKDLPDEHPAAFAHQQLFDLVVSTGLWDEADRLMPGFEVWADPRHPCHADWLLGMGRFALARGSIGEARTHWEHLLRVAREVGHGLHEDLAIYGLMSCEEAAKGARS